MIKSDNKKTGKPKIESKITIIKFDEVTYIKILKRGDKVVVRNKGGVLFSNC